MANGHIWPLFVMTVLEFADILLTEIEDADDPTSVESLRNAAAQAVMTGSGGIGALTSSAVNGKSFTKAVSLGPAEVLQACQLALAEWEGRSRHVAATVADFRNILR